VLGHVRVGACKCKRGPGFGLGHPRYRDYRGGVGVHTMASGVKRWGLPQVAMVKDGGVG
jgi:hypothetical protein